MAYPTSIKIIRVPCTGKVDSLHILRAFEKGADGAYVVGCLEGECHYTSGNIRARKRVYQAKEILQAVGIEAERVEMYNLSSSEAPRFVEVAKEMSEKIRTLGPTPLKLAKEKKAA